MAGIYIHIPFCGKKCPYCDFYSGTPSVSKMKDYTAAVVKQMEQWSDKNVKGESLYFGGGTPNLLGAERLSELICSAKSIFKLTDEAEITVEANPATVTEAFLNRVYSAGANRLSLGLQSSDEAELKLLGRRHNADIASKAVKMARRAGFNNISLDLMIGIPGQTMESLKNSVSFCAEQGVEHVSAYMLKIEEGTDFYKMKSKLNLPDEDTVSDMYLAAVDALAENGFEQYEISNFSKKGFEGRHNLIYWQGREYLSFGAAAHSFYDGRRFFYPSSTDAVIDGTDIIDDGPGGGRAEYAMLRLRLKDGLSDEIWMERFHEPLPDEILNSALKYEPAGLVEFSGKRSFYFTKEGFLVSNALITELTFDIDDDMNY